VPATGPAHVDKADNEKRRGKNVQVPLRKISQEAPVKLLIAALGGEGGGVLTNWNRGCGRTAWPPVQSTSIPGVAPAHRRHHLLCRDPADALECLERPQAGALAGAWCRRHLMLLLASELMEAGRAVASGFATAEQTVAITSTSRVYVIDEKIAMATPARIPAP